MFQYKQFIIQNRPRGFSLEPTAIRLLETESNVGQWNNNVIDDLKAQAIKRTDNVYVFPEQVADKITQTEIINTTEKWIKSFGCFSLAALRQRFQSRINNLSDDLTNFENFLYSLWEYDAYTTIWYPPLPLGKTRLTRSIGVKKEVVLKKLARCIEEIINKFCFQTEGQLLEKIPALDSVLLSTVVKDYLPFVTKVECDDLKWYCANESSVPSDLGERIVKCIQQIESVDLPVSEQTLHILLSLTYHTNFMKAYHISDFKTFRTLVTQYYNGQERKWKSGEFSIVNDQDLLD